MGDNIYDLLKSAHQVATTGGASIYGVEAAIVTNVKDPDKQGRVKVCMPRMPGKPESDWVRVSQPAAGGGRGFYWLPHVNDEVLLGFERGNASKPFIIGSLWNGKDKPMDKAYTDENTTVMVQTKSGHQIILSDKDGEETITIGDKTGKRTVTFDVKNKKFLIEAGEGDVIIKAEKKIIFDCEDLEIKTSKTGKLDIGSTFDLKIADAANITAGPKLVLKADKIELNPPSLSLAEVVAQAVATVEAAAAAAAAEAMEHMEAAAGGGGGGAGGAGGAAGAAGAGGGGGAAAGDGGGGDLSSDAAPAARTDGEIGGGDARTRDMGANVTATTSDGSGGSGAGTGGASAGGDTPGGGGTGAADPTAAGAGAGTANGAGTATATGAGTAAAEPAAAPDTVEVQLVNAAGAAQAGVEVELTLPSGEKRAGKTGDDGHFKPDGTGKGTARLLVPDIQKAAAGPASDPSRVRYVEGGIDVPFGKLTVVELPPVSRRARLDGMHFETAKTFLLPSAMSGIRMLVSLFNSYKNLAVLVNGHTDKQGSPGNNLGLSKERAESIAAFLKDDVQTWTKWYAGRPASKKWGTREDQYMLSTVVAKDGSGPYYKGPINGIPGGATSTATKAFQADNMLDKDGFAGKDTREALVRAYMALEGTSIPNAPMQLHGCGQAHPLPETAGDSNPNQPKNRRVEVFLFDGQVSPPPVDPCPSSGCAEYEQWVAQKIMDVDLDKPPGSLAVKVQDADSGSPLDGASVHLAGPIAFDKPTAGGTADFADLVPGHYKAIVDLDGFEANDAETDVASGAAGSLTVRLKQRPPMSFESVGARAGTPAEAAAYEKKFGKKAEA